MELTASVTGYVGASPKTKEKLGTVVLAYFPFYVKYINNLHKIAKDGTKVMVLLRGEMARKFADSIQSGDKLHVEGILTKKPYVDNEGVTRNWETVWADVVEFL
jgi:hypothetical protein